MNVVVSNRVGTFRILMSLIGLKISAPFKRFSTWLWILLTSWIEEWPGSPNFCLILVHILLSWISWLPLTLLNCDSVARMHLTRLPVSSTEAAERRLLATFDKQQMPCHSLPFQSKQHTEPSSDCSLTNDQSCCTCLVFFCRTCWKCLT